MTRDETAILAMFLGAGVVFALSWILRVRERRRIRRFEARLYWLHDPEYIAMRRPLFLPPPTHNDGCDLEC